MEEEIHVGVQEEVEREEQGVGDTREETKRGTEKQQTINHNGWSEDDMSARCTDTVAPLEPCGEYAHHEHM